MVRGWAEDGKTLGSIPSYVERSLWTHDTIPSSDLSNQPQALEGHLIRLSSVWVENHRNLVPVIELRVNYIAQSVSRYRR